MAGEQKGKAYEAFTKAALQALQKRRAFKGEIFWDDKPEGMSIIPDLSIGSDKNHPHTLILVTHCGSAKNSDMKYWRNMGELAEAKIFLPTVPLVFNLAFDSVIKENLKEAQAASFDGQLLVGDKKYGDKLQQWIDHNLPRFPKDKNKKVDFIVDDTRSDKALKLLLDQFTIDLEAVLKKNAPVELEQVWAMERKRTPGRAPRARDTFVRRGLSKLLIFEDLDVALRLFSGKRVKADEVPEYAYELGLTTRFTSGSSGIAKPADEEIVNAVTTLDSESILRVMSLAPLEDVSGWLDTLRGLAQLHTMSRFVSDNFENLLDPEVLMKKCLDLHSNPQRFITKPQGVKEWPPKHVWIVEIILELIKYCSGNSAGYGYAQMAREVAALPGMPPASDRVHSIVLSDWIHRRGAERMPGAVLRSVCKVLSDRLRQISKKGIDDSLVGLTDSVRINILEAKLCTYRGFEPLRNLIESKVSGCKLDKIRSCFGEKAELPGQATKTTVLRKGKTIINWQSCHGSHTNDKKKELCGRAVALRYSWDSKSNKFVRRPGIEKLILVLDGTWKREDLLTLARAGWDEIFYPDEMDKLAKAIV
jgi:hypothetical protein